MTGTRKTTKFSSAHSRLERLSARACLPWECVKVLKALTVLKIFLRLVTCEIHPFFISNLCIHRQKKMIKKIFCNISYNLKYFLHLELRSRHFLLYFYFFTLLKIDIRSCPSSNALCHSFLGEVLLQKWKKFGIVSFCLDSCFTLPIISYHEEDLNSEINWSDLLK